MPVIQGMNIPECSVSCCSPGKGRQTNSLNQTTVWGVSILYLGAPDPGAWHSLAKRPGRACSSLFSFSIHKVSRSGHENNKNPPFSHLLLHPFLSSRFVGRGRYVGHAG